MKTPSLHSQYFPKALIYRLSQAEPSAVALLNEDSKDLAISTPQRKFEECLGGIR